MSNKSLTDIILSAEKQCIDDNMNLFYYSPDIICEVFDFTEEDYFKNTMIDLMALGILIQNREIDKIKNIPITKRAF